MKPLGFDDWLDELETVILPDFGFEPSEFTVYAEHWRPAYDQKKTPREAFQSALDAHGEARREEEAAKRANWERIQREDREAIQRYRASQSH